MEEMEGKTIATTRKITGELLGGFFLYGILWGIVYYFVYNFIVKRILGNSPIFVIIVGLILQAGTVYMIWRNSTSSTFKKRTMYSHQVPTVMRSLIIFTLIICILNTIFNFLDLNKQFEKTINSNYKLQIAEMYMNILYNDEQMVQYQIEKQKAIDEVKKQVYIYFAILEVGILVIYIGILPLEKKNILKYTIEGDYLSNE